MAKMTLLQAMSRKSAYCAIKSVASVLRHDDGTLFTDAQVETVANEVANSTVVLVARDEAKGLNEHTFELMRDEETVN